MRPSPSIGWAARSGSGNGANDTRSRTAGSAMRNWNSRTRRFSSPRRRGTTRVRGTTAKPARPRGNGPPCPGSSTDQDRKSTRLNSSHITISYAVFCLKKKKKKKLKTKQKKKTKKTKEKSKQ